MVKTNDSSGVVVFLSCFSFGSMASTFKSVLTFLGLTPKPRRSSFYGDAKTCSDLSSVEASPYRPIRITNSPEVRQSLANFLRDIGVPEDEILQELQILFKDIPPV